MERGRVKEKKEGESTSYEAPFHLEILRGLVPARRLSHGWRVLSGVLQSSVARLMCAHTA